MNSLNTSGSAYLRLLENKYKSDLKSAIARFREWERRRSEVDVAHLVIAREGELLRKSIEDLHDIYRDTRSWRVSAPTS